MRRPLLLDLFAGAGGAAVGYDRAGFDVVGVDNRPQPRYPFLFVEGDALDFVRRNGHHFVAIHASPPCQRYSRASGEHAANHPDRVGPTRQALIATGKPYVIENVVGAPLLSPIMLCGTMFGLQVFRHRLFESNWPLLAPCHTKHAGSTGTHRWPYRPNGYYEITGTGGKGWTMPEGRAAMGIDWPMTRPELVNAIPPAFTEFIGHQLLRAVAWTDAA